MMNRECRGLVVAGMRGRREGRGWSGGCERRRGVRSGGRSGGGWCRLWEVVSEECVACVIEKTGGQRNHGVGERIRRIWEEGRLACMITRFG
jgi:hypothetical protein